MARSPVAGRERRCRAREDELNPSAVAAQGEEGDVQDSEEGGLAQIVGNVFGGTAAGGNAHHRRIVGTPRSRRGGVLAKKNPPREPSSRSGWLSPGARRPRGRGRCWCSLSTSSRGPRQGEFFSRVLVRPPPVDQGDRAVAGGVRQHRVDLDPLPPVRHTLCNRPGGRSRASRIGPAGRRRGRGIPVRARPLRGRPSGPPQRHEGGARNMWFRTWATLPGEGPGGGEDYAIFGGDPYGRETRGPLATRSPCPIKPSITVPMISDSPIGLRSNPKNPPTIRGSASR